MVSTGLGFRVGASGSRVSGRCVLRESKVSRRKAPGFSGLRLLAVNQACMFRAFRPEHFKGCVRREGSAFKEELKRIPGPQK